MNTDWESKTRWGEDGGWCFPSHTVDKQWDCGMLGLITWPPVPATVSRSSKMLFITYKSAVYTCIKKPESFSHSGFSLKVARQLPLNTPKKPNWKTHLRSVIFWNSAKISLFFCQCKRSLQSRRYYSGFWSRGMWPSAESPDRGPRRNAHYTCTVKGREKSRMRTTIQVWDLGFFAHALFVPKTPNAMGFSGSLNGTTWILVFANVNGPREAKVHI